MRSKPRPGRREGPDRTPGANPDTLLWAFLDVFIPPVVIEARGPAYERARLVVASVVLMFTAVLLLLPPILILQGMDSITVRALGVMAVMLFGNAAFVRLGHVNAAAILIPVEVVFAFTLVAVRRGGLDTVNLLAFPVVPLLSAFLAGRRAAIMMTGLISLVTLGLFDLTNKGAGFVEPYGGGERRVIVAVGVVIASAFVMVIASFYDHARERSEALALRRLQELRETNLELLEARDAAFAANRAKSEFLARMSHEIRTPMHGVLGMNQLLLASELRADQREYAAAIRQSAKALLSVIDDILDFSKLEVGGVKIREDRFDPRDVVEEAVGLVARLAQGKGLELAAIVTPEVPGCVFGDPTRARQVLVNLLGNAVKYTERGEIVLRVSARQAGMVRFEVSDTGVGVPEEFQHALFEAFTQADSFISRRQGGTGLGLAISRELVRLMGGTIEANSRPGEGSRFWFTLPLKVGVWDIGHEEPAEIPVGVRVLVVDDHAASREAAVVPLRAWGAKVLEASQGADALDQLRAAEKRGEPIDLVLLDFQMPKMSGLDVIRVMRGERGLRTVPVILVTPVGTSMDLATRGGGVVGRLGRPVIEGQLRRAVARAFGAGPASTDSTPSVTTSSTTIPPVDVGDRGRVLVAEDNAVARTLATLLLQRLGHEVVAVENGRLAVDRVLAERFDVVLMDCQMPEMDGYEAAAEIRRREATPGRIRIVAVTAHALPEEQRRCLEAGMNGYLSKPFMPAQLSEAVSRQVRAARGGEAGNEGGRNPRAPRDS
ncbi:MAG: response regulator [Myxococcales bacterium]|nr:response regulator [Myxococcales bacterium]